MVEGLHTAVNRSSKLRKKKSKVRRELHDLADPVGAQARKSARDRKHVDDLHVSQACLCLQLAGAQEKVMADVAAERRVQAQNMVEDMEVRQAWARTVQGWYPWAPEPWTRSSEQQQWAAQQWQFPDGSARW